MVKKVNDYSVGARGVPIGTARVGLTKSAGAAATLGRGGALGVRIVGKGKRHRADLYRGLAERRALGLWLCGGAAPGWARHGVPCSRDQGRGADPDWGKFVVTRTDDAGASFAMIDAGLPSGPAWDLIYRHGLAIGDSGARLAMESTTGNL